MEKALRHDLKITNLKIFIDDLYWLCVCVCVHRNGCVCVRMQWCTWPLVKHALTYADVCGRMMTYTAADGR